ncbi:class I SAM-dependent methyltransferase [bacterium]|nr:MAG: class I SAM-dependent methyltransferase [bacterium]
MEPFECRICKNQFENKSYFIKEMMFGLREQFKYTQCSQCGCLQIDEIPKNMLPYYPNNYYAYQSVAKKTLRRALGVLVRKSFLRLYVQKKNSFNTEVLKVLLQRQEYKWVTNIKNLKLSSDILDIGCAKGDLLLDLKNLGFQKLTGIDPFIDQDIIYPSGVQIFKKSLFEIERCFDLIMLNHSFEHMDNPHLVFERLYHLLNSGGHLLIRIPVVDSYSWRKYGISWYQIDAPRHFFLHTVKSMTILAKDHGFETLNVEYDGNENQFTFSEKYIRDKSLTDKVEFAPKLLSQWKKHSKQLNRMNDGDQASFLFLKK